jgi:hypothetical protein
VHMCSINPGVPQNKSGHVDVLLTPIPHFVILAFHSEKPFALLLPNYTINKQYYKELVSKLSGSGK